MAVREAATRAGAPPDPSSLPGAAKAACPAVARPQLATLAREAPEGGDWLHEIKYDGYRALVRVEGGGARAFSRRGLDWTDRFRSVAEALARLPTGAAWIDGEVCVQRPDGRTDFQLLQEDLGAGRFDRLVFFAFDLLHLDGWDLRRVPLELRKQVLERLLAARPQDRVQYSRHVEGNGRAFHAQACRMGLEGIVSKRRAACYEGRRGGDWLKVKCMRRDEAVVGGFTAPQGSRTGFGALLVGWYDAGGALRYGGRVGTGFDERMLRRLTAELAALETDTSPFTTPVPREHARRARWARPELVAEVEYGEITRDGLLRHPSFKGLREDLDPRAVRPPPVPIAPDTAAPRREAPSAEAPRGRKSVRTRRPTVAGVALSNPDRVLFPDPGVTKLELARFYEEIASAALPHMAGRLLTLVRCPEGADRPCFFQKHERQNLPDAIRSMRMREKSGEAPYVFVDSVEGLVSLVQMNFLEIHPWGSRVDRLERPDRLTFDLDPAPELPWARVVEAAREVRARLDDLGLVSFCKTTGGKGLHVVVPIVRRSTWDEAKAFTRAVAEALVRTAPERYVAEASKQRRTGRVFIDWLRNARGATAVAPFSTRARPGAPVATPVAWDELDDLGPDAFHVRNLRARLATLPGDPWEGFASTRQGLTAERRRELGL